MLRAGCLTVTVFLLVFIERAEISCHVYPVIVFHGWPLWAVISGTFRAFLSPSVSGNKLR